VAQPGDDLRRMVKVFPDDPPDHEAVADDEPSCAIGGRMCAVKRTCPSEPEGAEMYADLIGLGAVV
jgi:hypothetical protein